MRKARSTAILEGWLLRIIKATAVLMCVTLLVLA